MCRTEREGFDLPRFSQVSEVAVITRNVRLTKDLRHSSCPPSIIVKSRYERTEPGQIRDKSIRAFPLPRRARLVTITLGRPSCGHLLKRGNKRANTDRCGGMVSPAPAGSCGTSRRKRRRQSRRRLRGAIYARFSSRFQHSVEDQIRTCETYAAEQGIEINPQHIFADRAERGCKRRRAGFKNLMAALDRGEIDVVIIMATNRLYRKVYKSLQFVEEEIVERGIRCVFVAQGIDTSDESAWRLHLQFYAMMDENAAAVGAAHIQAAHQGMLLDGLVWGTVTFGYRAVAIDGRQTRRGLPRRKVVIDPVESEWVVRVFQWCIDGFTIAQIVRSLNDQAAPPPPKSGNRRWSRLAVLHLLRNSRYRGLWEYGVKKCVWLNKKDYGRQIPRDKPLLSKQVEELRIVSDDLWFAAQKQLDKICKWRGTRKSKGIWKNYSVLSGLLYCAKHGTPLRASGARGGYYSCAKCKSSSTPDLFSSVRRDLCQRLVCERIAELLGSDDDLIDQVITICQSESERMQRPDPVELEQLARQIASLTGKIDFLMEAGAETDEDRAENMQKLRDLRAKRADLRSKEAAIRKVGERMITVPTRTNVIELAAELGQILHNAACGGTEAARAQARQIIEIATGGKIEVHQMGERRAQRGWLRGVFQCDVVKPIAGRQLGSGSDAAGSPTSVVIDLREATPAEQAADRVKELYDGGLLIKEIADEIHRSRNFVTKALNAWFARHGGQAPDGRSRRSTLNRKHREPPLYQRVAAEVKKLADEGLLMQHIAAKVDIDRNTATKALRFACNQAGVPATDGRTRRQTLTRNASRRQTRSS